jgi:adenosylhomocysteine nucleosidase
VKPKGIGFLGLFLAVWALASSPAAAAGNADVVVLISANAEWKTVRAYFKKDAVARAPFGEFISREANAGGKKISIVYFHGGWGKISAAASTQYAVDRWRPRLLVNLGTCGGFEGRVEAGDLLLVDKTVVYDIVEMMGDADAAVADYTTVLDLGWLKKPYPARVIESLLVSADRDIQPADIPGLQTKFGAVAGDWESGAIAFTAKRNGVPCLILRAVSDIVGKRGGDVYGNIEMYEKRTQTIMVRLLDMLPAWLQAAGKLFE